MKKTLQLLAATLILGSASTVLTPATAHAQDKDKMMQMGKTMMMMNDMNDMDRYKMQWVFRNLDAREVKRYKAAGFDEETIKGAANIAMKTGLPLDYIIRRIKISGYSLTQLASMFGVATTVPDDDIPGMGMETIAVEPMNDSGMMMRK